MIQRTDGIFSPPRISQNFSASSIKGELSTVSSASNGPVDTHPFSRFSTSCAVEDVKPTLLYGLPPSFNCDEYHSNSRRQPTRFKDTTMRPSKGSNDMLPKELPSQPDSTANNPSNVALSSPHQDSSGQLNAEEYLTEVPLHRVSEEIPFQQTNLSTASPFLARTVERKAVDSLQTLTLSPSKNGTTSVTPKSLDKDELQDDDDVLSEFLRSHGDPHPISNLPSVEDGLSSGSELDTPHTKCKNKNQFPSTNEHLPSCSPDSTRDLFPGICRESQRWRPPDKAINSGTLIDPPLVQDIWEIVHEIKQTLSEDKSILDRSIGANSRVLHERLHDTSTSTASNSRDKSHHTDTHQPQQCYMNNSSKVDSAHSMGAYQDSYNQSCSEKNGCERITVRASIEHQATENEPDAELNVHNQSTVYQSRSEANSSPNQVPANRETHQWTFPTASNTVYSSSEEDAHETNSDQVSRSHVEPRGKTRTPKKCAMNNAQRRINAHPNSTSEPSVAHHGPSGLAPQNQSVRAGMSPPSQAVNSRDDYESDEDTDQLLEKPYQSDQPVYIPELKREANLQTGRQNRVREVSVRHPDFPETLIRGVLFRANYLGSTQLLSQRQPTRNSRMYQAQEAVNRVKAPDGENQPSVGVALFVSTDRIMLLNSNLQEILIDHELKTVSYIADIGEIFVLMARRPDPIAETTDEDSETKTSEQKEDKNDAKPADTHAGHTGSGGQSPDHKQPTSKLNNPESILKHREPSAKLICHVLESGDARLIAQAVGNAFQLAYLDFLRENGIEDLSSVKHLNYEDVLNQQEIFCDELTMFSDKDRHKQITIPKQRGEALGVVIVSSGWGSLLPTALLANMNPTGPAARCGQLNIGNHIISVNGQSLVGLPLNTCQNIIKSCRNQTAIKLVVVDCPPVVEVLIRRPSLQYQLGFSVQDGIICSLLRGGIAERGGIRVDHRIIEINGQSVVAVSHDRIVHMLATAVGEIHIRTMPTSVFRLLTGQDTPNYI